ncbi:MAG: hypothetical protein ACI4KM_10265 [Oscillospiraceae bacterium]
MNTIEDILKQIAEEAFDGISSELIMIRLRSLYGYALKCAEPDKLQKVIADIIGYESENSLSTMLILEAYDSLSVERMLSDFSSAAMYFAKNRADTGTIYSLAGYMLKGFMFFVDNNEKEIEALGGFGTVSETLLDFNYACAASDNLSLRMRNYLL